MRLGSGGLHFPEGQTGLEKSAIASRQVTPHTIPMSKAKEEFSLLSPCIPPPDYQCQQVI